MSATELQQILDAHDKWTRKNGALIVAKIKELCSLLVTHDAAHSQEVARLTESTLLEQRAKTAESQLAAACKQVEGLRKRIRELDDTAKEYFKESATERNQEYYRGCQRICFLLEKALAAPATSVNEPLGARESAP